MALGSVLIKPQPVTIPLTDKVEPAEVIVDLLEALTRDPEATAPALHILLEEGGSALRDFVISREERLRFADGKIRALFRPFGEALDLLVNGIQDDVAGSVPAVLQAISRLVSELTGDKVARLVEQFFDIAEKDLGISGEALRTLAQDIVTRSVTRMKERSVNGESTAEATALYDFGCSLDGLALMLADDIEVPGVNSGAAAGAIRDAWQKAGIDDVLGKIGQVLALGETLVEPLAAFADIVMDVNVNVSVSPGGADGVEGAEVEVEVAQNPDDPISWYSSWVAGRLVRFQPDFTDNPYLFGFDFKHVSREKMEKIAFHTAWAASAFEAFLHVLSAEQGDLAENLVNLAANGVDIGLVAFDKPRLLEQVNFPHPRYVRMLTFLAHNFLTGLEGGRFGDSNDPYVWTMLGGDLGEAVLYRRWAWLLREALLSFLTLYNHDPAAFTAWQQERRGQISDSVIRRAVKFHNHNHFDGVCYFMAEFGGMLLPLILSRTDRANYGFIGGSMPGAMLGKAIGGMAINWSFMYLSILIARIPAGEFPSDWWRYVLLPLKERVYGEYKLWPEAPSSGGEKFLYVLKDLLWDLPRVFVTLVMYVVDHGIYLYLFTDGSTDDGKYCYDPAATEREFMGYPDDPDNSPYRLPWAADTMLQCVQGNMGIWSHYPQGNGQTYAYDFSHDKGTEVLCSRTGIVTWVDDTQPDNNPNRWNSVEVMHLIVYPPGSASGSPGVPPVGTNMFADGVTAIPPGTLFPPYWDAAGNPLPGMPNPVSLHPSAAILAAPLAAPAYYAGFTGFPAGSRFAFIDTAYDRALEGITVPPGVTFVGGGAIPPNVVFTPDTAVPPPAGSRTFPVGTTFLPPGTISQPPISAGRFEPLSATFGVYGHGLFGFMHITTAPPSPPVAGVTTTPRPSGLPDVYRSGTANQVLGLYVQQGQPVMLSGDTGISAYNHLHTHVLGASNTVDTTFTLPFLYSDAVHDMRNGFREALRHNGRPRAMTFYVSKNTRIGPS